MIGETIKFLDGQMLCQLWISDQHGWLAEHKAPDNSNYFKLKKFWAVFYIFAAELSLFILELVVLFHHRLNKRLFFEENAEV